MQERARISKRIPVWIATITLFVIVVGTAIANTQSSFDVTITLKDGHRVTFTGIQATGRKNAANLAWQKLRAEATTNVTPTAPPPPPPPPPAGDQFPNPSTTGTPAGWVPKTVTSSSITVTQPGAVVQDVRLTGGAGITVKANNVIIRRVDLQGGTIDNDAGPCGNGLLIEDTTIEPTSPNGAVNDREGVVSYGGYTARRVEIVGRSEGLRVSSVGDCGPVTVEDSFIRIVPPTPCGDWHGDGIQGWYGDAVTVRNVTIDARTTGCTGTAPFFYPRNQGNTRATIDRLLVAGQGYSFRDGMPGSVTGLRVVNGSWIFGPVDVQCTALSAWEAKIVNIDSTYAVTSVVRDQPCTGSGT
jgi:hypothetical protein